MKPKTQAEIILENYGLSAHPHADGLINTIERAVIAVIEEKNAENAALQRRLKEALTAIHQHAYQTYHLAEESLEKLNGVKR